MKVDIMFADKTIKSYDKVKMICNASLRQQNDWIYIYRIGDIHGHPSIQLPLNTIICIEAAEDWYKCR